MKTVQIVFARGAVADAPVEIAVEPLQAGPQLRQQHGDHQPGRPALHPVRWCCCRPTSPTSSATPTRRRRTSTPEDGTPGRARPGRVGGPHRSTASTSSDPDAVGPAELDVWTRFVGAPDDPATDQALLAFATDGFLIGTAMRPHAGVGQAQAHVTLTTGVVSHTLTFHEPCRAGDWMLLENRSPYAGRGRAYGRADVFDATGTWWRRSCRTA